jgi:Secretion system C-terminal sorting domain
MKNLFFILLFLSFNSILSAQKPDTLWTKTYGGSQTECYGYGTDAQVRVDINNNNQIFITTSSTSSDYDVHSSYGSVDCFIVKTNEAGDTLWTKVVGGNDYDIPRDIIALDDGGCIVAGWTYSNSDLMVGHHGDTMSEDGFVFRLDSLGEIVWLKQYGGSDFIGIPGRDKIFDIMQMQNGNFLALGQTNSNNGDLTMDLSMFYVGWLLEINADGIIQTSKKLCWTNHDENNPDYFEEGIQLSDGSGFLCFGESVHGLSSSKFWVMKLDNSFNEIWQYEYGCSSYNVPFSITEAENNSAVFTGWVQSGGGDVSGSYYGGILDAWVAKIDSSGSLVCDKIIGGSESEIPSRIISLNSKLEFYFSGSTRSTDYYGGGDTTTAMDFWLIKLDQNLDSVWTFKPGGTLNDAATDIVLSKQGNNLFVVGKSESNDLYVNNNYGDKDIWLSLIQDNHVGISESEKLSNIAIYPNPCENYFKINKNIETLRLYNVLGTLVFSAKNINKNTTVNIPDLSPSLYLIELISEGESVVTRLIIN